MGPYDVARSFFFYLVRDLDFSFVLRLLFFHVLYVRSFSTYIVIFTDHCAVSMVTLV